MTNILSPAEKQCSACNQVKPIIDFHKNKSHKHGYNSWCKPCCKSYFKNRIKVIKSNPEKYFTYLNTSRINQIKRIKDGLTKPSKESHIKASRKTYLTYPEKSRAMRLCKGIKPPDGYERHHWSYKEEFARDVIFLSKKDHKKIHRYIQYDKSQWIYRTKFTNVLLDTRDKHEIFIREMLEKMPD